MSKTVDLHSWLPQAEATPQKEARLFLTESEVRSHARFKHASPEEVQHIITSLHHLALVAYEAFNRTKEGNPEKDLPLPSYEAGNSEEAALHSLQPLKAA